MTLDQLLDALWETYRRDNPQVQAIHDLLAGRGETIVNDHIALRTFDDPRAGIDALAAAFVQFGYRPGGEYRFPEKKLFARHYEHPEEGRPKVFISELQLAAFSDELRATVQGLLGHVTADTLARWDLAACGRPWPIRYEQYERLRRESEYAAWVAAFGFRANHFTVLVNRLTTFRSLQELNEFLKAQGFKLNASGGEIKGSPADLLEQSSTLADEAEVNFADGRRRIPCCYYEFARRYPDADGRLFQGFVAKSADRIFESTDQRPPGKGSAMQ